VSITGRIHLYAALLVQRVVNSSPDFVCDPKNASNAEIILTGTTTDQNATVYEAPSGASQEAHRVG